jgi:hypothetical protein
MKTMEELLKVMNSLMEMDKEDEADAGTRSVLLERRHALVSFLFYFL